MTAKPLTKTQLELFEKFGSREEHDQMVSRLLAGSSKFTLTSEKTGQRFTYWIRSGAKDRNKNWSTGNQNLLFFFVKVLTGPDNESSFTWMGTIQRQSLESMPHFSARRDFSAAPSRFAIEWFLHHLFVGGVIPQGATLEWASSCARCGRTLTVPESIQSGFGPECIGYV